MWTCCPSWVRHKGHAIAVSFWSFTQFSQDNSMTFGTCMHTQWVAGSERNLQFGKYQSFIMGCRQPCSIIFLGGIGPISKQSSSPRKASCPLLENTQKYRPEGSRLSEVTTAWGQSRASIIEISVIPDAEQDPLMKSSGRDTPADKGALYTMQNKKETQWML